MSQHIDPPPGEDIERLEARLRSAAGRMQYPPTPKIARAVRARLEKPRGAPTGLRLARAALIALVGLSALMAVPGVRAAVLDFFRVGEVRIFIAPPTATPTPEIKGTKPQRPITATPAATLTDLPQSLLDGLDGLTTLDDARARADFPVLLPGYPPDLGKPDRVYVQTFGDAVVILVWMDPDHPGQARLSLEALGPQQYAFKIAGGKITELEVNGQYAVWVEQPHMLYHQRGQTVDGRLVEGHVLIFTSGQTTYRLETPGSLDEALKTAQSLH